MEANVVAVCVLQVFQTLPAKAKPRIYHGGEQEWTTLAGIVVAGQDLKPTCVSLGTGMRCLPSNKLPLANGSCLHDWHAEVVAVRAFNQHLLHECERILARNGENGESGIVRKRMREELTAEQPQLFAIKDDVCIAMYCSEAPCGDASMELLMQAQADPTPWAVNETDHDLLDGRGHFSKLGVVRRKPARADAPPTTSKSCSDKLALKQCTSLLNSLTSLLICPGNTYLTRLILPSYQIVPTSTERCFGRSGRMSTLISASGIAPTWDGGYNFRPFKIESTKEDFTFSRAASTLKGKSSGSNITACWTPESFEVLISGTKSGFKQFSERGRSTISRAAFWSTTLRLAESLKDEDLIRCLQEPSYALVKQYRLLAPRRAVKEDVKKQSLRGWVRNEGDDDFHL